MCFSTSASFLAAAPLTAIGVATLRKTNSKTEIPFASFPLFFGIQQFIEGIVWLTFMHSMPILHILATYSYAVFAYVLWPILTPFAMWLIEPISWRKNVLSLLGAIGAIVGLYLLYCISQNTLTARVTHDSIVYKFSNPFSDQSILAYLTAVCVSFFISSRTFVRLFGVLIVISLTATYFFHTTYVVSVWCFFAALLSGLIYFYFSKKAMKLPRISRM